jgi:hypothetical protein
LHHHHHILKKTGSLLWGAWDLLAPSFNGRGAYSRVGEFVDIDEVIAIDVESQGYFINGLAVGGARLELVKGLSE